MNALHMSAFRGKADMTIGTCPLSRSLSDVKQTSIVATHMSAFDPKRTLTGFSAPRSVHNSATSLIRYGRADAGPGYSILASVGKLPRHAGPERIASNP